MTSMTVSYVERAVPKEEWPKAGISYPQGARDIKVTKETLQYANSVDLKTAYPNAELREAIRTIALSEIEFYGNSIKALQIEGTDLKKQVTQITKLPQPLTTLCGIPRVTEKDAATILANTQDEQKVRSFTLLKSYVEAVSTNPSLQPELTAPVNWYEKHMPTIQAFVAGAVTSVAVGALAIVTSYFSK